MATVWVCTGALLLGAAGVWLGNPKSRDLPTTSWTAPAEASSGTLPLVLGGFRGVAAGLVWLRVQLAWERGDEASVMRWSALATSLDPQVVAYWTNGARMLAYDFADVRLREAAKRGVATEALRGQIDREQARLALGRLEAALHHHPDDPRLLIEMGNIHLHRRNDLEQAAACYGRAARHPAAPLYTQRIRAGLLWRLGRRSEGLQVLENHHQWLVQTGVEAVDPELVATVGHRIEAWRRELEAQ